MSRCILVGTRKGLFFIEKSASKSNDPWRIAKTQFLGDPVSQVLFDQRSGAIYAALELGHFGVKLHVSRDGGDSFEEISAPAYPKAEGSEDGDATSLKSIFSFAAPGEDQPGVLWCGTLPGGLFKSEDDGASWELVRSLWDLEERKQWFGGGTELPALHSILVDPRDSNHLTLGISCGGVWVTRDGGESWACKAKGMFANYLPPDKKEEQNLQDPHSIVCCRSDPDVLWCQHHNGIFRSTDGAESWHEIKDVAPSSFGFVTRVHPNLPDTAWFVPAIKDEARYPVDAQVVVTRTRDGGKSFDILREGLPQADAYDLVYRHALDVDESGDKLAMGSTTGNLWISENQGDAWKLLNGHLPPVYCVLFIPE